jgi:hypothetical protein
MGAAPLAPRERNGCPLSEKDLLGVKKHLLDERNPLEGVSSL